MCSPGDPNRHFGCCFTVARQDCHASLKVGIRHSGSSRPPGPHVFRLEAAAISCETRFTTVFAFDIASLTSYRKLRRDPYRDSDEVHSEPYRYSDRRSCIASHIAIRITFNSDPDRFWGDAENSGTDCYPDLNERSESLPKLSMTGRPHRWPSSGGPSSSRRPPASCPSR